MAIKDFNALDHKIIMTSETLLLDLVHPFKLIKRNLRS